MEERFLENHKPHASRNEKLQLFDAELRAVLSQAEQNIAEGKTRGYRIVFPISNMPDLGSKTLERGVLLGWLKSNFPKWKIAANVHTRIYRDLTEEEANGTRTTASNH